MSQAHHPDFTVFGAILKTFQVMREEFIFFAIIITLYVVLGTVPVLFLFEGMDLTNPTVILEQMQSGQSYLLLFYLIFYLLFAILIVNILDRTNANLNNYSVKEYPYVKRALQTVVPVILVYLISMILIIIGFILLIVPGFIVLAGLYLAIPSKLAENISFFTAISRSWKLTKGHRLAILGVILIPMVPMLLISYWLGYSMMSDVVESGDLSAFTSPTMLTLNALIGGIFTVFMLTASGVVYHQISKEVIEEAPLN